MHHSRLCAVIIDCRTEDLDDAARFWSAALGRALDGSYSGDVSRYRMLETPPGEVLVEVQSVSHESRVHLDIETDDVHAEVARLEKLGAVVDQVLPGWVVMRAPTGQRFCVVRVQRPGVSVNAIRWE